MRTWFTQYRAVAVSVISVLIICLVLLVVIAQQGLSERTIAASLLILSFTVFSVGGVMFTGRAIFKWPIDNMTSYLIWERGFVITATLATVLGLAGLEDMLHAAGEPILARLGMVGYLVGAVVVLIAETAYLSKREWNDAQVVFYAIVALLAQAAFGASLLQTGLVAAWVGWVTILWNLGLLLVMLVIRPREIYYPAIHYVAPLIIGVTLLAGGWV